MDMKSRVFVVQEPIALRNNRPSPRFSLDPAKEFGELVFLLDWSEIKGSMSGVESEVMWKLRERLAGFCDDDYILMTGDWGAMALSCMIAAEINDGRARCLQWEQNARKYRVVELDMNSPPRRIGEQ